jgi:hypothetical protein
MHSQQNSSIYASSGNASTLGSTATVSGTTYYYSGLSNGTTSINSLDDCVYRYGDVHCSECETFALMLDHLSEDDIKATLNAAMSRTSDKTLKSTFVKFFVRKTHLSESFLLEYIDYLSKEDIMVQHKREIISGDYSNLLVYMEVKEN